MTKEDKITEEKIFDAATEEFEEKGMEGARMQDIANRAGINKALLHYYFLLQDKLFAAVFDKLAEKMFQKFAGVFEMDLPIDKKIEFFFREHMSFLEKNPKLPLFILSEINRNPELLSKFMSKIDFNWIKKGMNDSIPGENLSDNLMAHVMISTISLSVFPILAKPIIEGVLNTQDIKYKDFLQERKEFSPWFIMTAVKGLQNESLKDKKK